MSIYALKEQEDCDWLLGITLSTFGHWWRSM